MSTSADRALGAPPATQHRRAAGPAAADSVAVAPPTSTLAGWMPAVYVIAATILFSFPLLAALWFRADPLSVANESIAYRFLYSERLLAGEGTRVWVLAGFTTTAIQNILLAAIDTVWGISRETLRARVHAFAVGTSVIHCGAAAAIFFLAGRSPWLRWPDRLLLALVALGPLYLTHTSGFYYYLLPDYYLTNVVLVLVATFVFQLTWRRPPDAEARWAFVMRGALAGVMVANKITLAPLAVLLLAPALLTTPLTPPRVLRRVGVAAAAALAAVAGVLLVFYVFRINAPGRAFGPWLDTVLNPGGEGAFWGSAFSGYIVGQSYGYIIALWLASLCVSVAVTWTSGERAPRTVIALAINGLSSAAWCYFLYKRPAGTTFFEASVMLLALAACALTLVASTPRGRAITVGAVVVSGVFAFHAFGLEANLRFLRPASTIADHVWRMQDELIDFARGRQIIVIHPSNDHGYGGVPEFLLKGSAQTPTWNVGRRGQEIVDRYAPRMTFRHEYSGTSPSGPLPADAVVYWVDLGWRRPLTEIYSALAAAESNGANPRRRWVIDYPYANGQVTGHALLLRESASAARPTP